MTVDFQAGPPRPQVPLNAVSFHQWLFPDGTVWAGFYRSGESYLLRFPGLADFSLSSDGLRIEGWPAPGTSDATLQHLYLNQVLPLALNRQGKLVVHGSAVEIDGAGVAFIGQSGRGKSTLAASFASSGFRLLADDGLLLEPADGDYWIRPSHPSIRLWEDSEEALALESAHKAPPVQFTAKTRFLAGAGIAFCDQPRRLRRAYFLGEGGHGDPTFERVNSASALIELVKHSFLLDPEERGAMAAHFDELSGLANRPIFHRLDYPRRFENLPQTRQAIIEHINEGYAEWS